MLKGGGGYFDALGMKVCVVLCCGECFYFNFFPVSFSLFVWFCCSFVSTDVIGD